MAEQSNRVTIYTTPACPWCGVAKRYFVEKGIDFTEVDVAQDRRGLRQMVVTTGQYGVPVIVVGEKAMVGWNVPEFRRLYSRASKRF
ncbi:MAG: glutaredoxin family protein [Coriobacteriia bacterium]|nr:glutaredoxin family protein [Coriobacteriia bacterium]